MFSDSASPLSWDKENAYTRDSSELYYEVGSGVRLSKKEIMSNFLQSTVASHLKTFGDDETDAVKSSPEGIPSVGDGHSNWVKVNERRTLHAVLKEPRDGCSKWVKVNERRTLHAVLKEPSLVIPGIPVFFVVSEKSRFYKDFKSGNWSLQS